MMTTNAAGVVSVTPPLTAQLNEVAPIAGATLPAPWVNRSSIPAFAGWERQRCSHVSRTQDAAG